MQARYLLMMALAGAAAGYGLARLPAPAAGPTGPRVEAAPRVEVRLQELERALGQEREARQLLEEELLVLRDLVESRPASAAEPSPAAATVAGNVAGGPRRSDAGGGSRTARLEAAGIEPARAAWIVEREAAMQYELLQARHDAERGGDYTVYRDMMMNRDAAFRDEIGEADYERYLQATGRSTSVTVSGVMEASPAQSAGLQPGDEIVRYAGRRVYDLRDLNRLTLEGRAGETVYVEVLRDGMPIQLALPRGPVGIMSGGGRRRQ